MSKRCIYCKTDIDQNSVVDVCVRCGHNVWGEKMFKAIIDNMEGARASGDLHQGSVGDSLRNPSENVSKQDDEPQPAPEPNPEPPVPEPQPSPEPAPQPPNTANSMSIGGEVYSDF